MISTNSGINIPVAVYYRDPSNKPQNVTSANKIQEAAFGSAGILFIASGMNLALGLGWNISTGIVNSSQFMYCWFVAVIVGVVIAAPLISVLPKRIFALFSAVLITAAGILFTSAPYNFRCILAGRCLNGFGTGFAMVSFLVHSGEISPKAYRGTSAGIEQYSISLGIAIQVIFESQWSGVDFAANRVNGIISIVMGVIAFLVGLFIIESPIYHLHKNNNGEALECVRRIYRESAVTDNTKIVLDEFKAYVDESVSYTFGESFMQGLLPLIKMILLRSMVAFCFTLPLSSAIETAAIISIGNNNAWPMILYGILRLIGALLILFLIDNVGRKLAGLFTLLIVGGFSIGIGVIFADTANLFDSHQMSIVVTLALLLQVFAGMFTPCTSVYLSEAFPLQVKPYFIAFCIAIEQVIQIIIIKTIYLSPHTLFVYHLTVGIIICVFCVIFCFILPETRKVHLKDASQRFQQTIYIKFY